MERVETAPSQKAVVVMLTRFLREESRTITTKGGHSTTKVYVVFQCPNEHCKERNREISFQKRSGYVNPFNHLRTCIADGSAEQLYKVYNENLSLQQKHGLDLYFKPSVLRVTPKEQALHDYIHMIVFKNLPIAIVEDMAFRSFSKHNDRFSRKTVKDVMFKTVELVERAIAKELQAAKCGAILHDGWTCGGVHYIGLFASFLRKIKTTTSKGVSVIQDIVELSLLSCSPMAKLSDQEEDEDYVSDDDEAVNFSAQTHCEHIKSMFLYYHIDVCDWAVCQIADNCRVNKSVAKVLGMPHVGCKSHLLNLEVNYMVRGTQDLDRTIDSVHETMNQCKQRLKNAALLRNLVALRPIIHNKTRWSGKYFMLQRFLRIRDELIEVSQEECSDLTVNATNAFKSKVLRYTKQMRRINFSTKFLQTRKLALARCRESLNLLIEDVQEGFSSPDSDLYRCSLGKKYIAVDADILPDPHFESGVCKIQNDEVNDMTEAEHAACDALLESTEQEGQLSNEDSEAEMTYEERLHRRKKRRTNEKGYGNCDFILGSAAEVERLWSVADNILTDQRMSMTPLLFETIIFLRVNERLWNAQLIKKAFHMAKSEKVKSRHQEDDNQELFELDEQSYGN